MTSRKRFNIEKSGFILFDIMLSLVLAAVFISLITEISFEAQDIFDRARKKTAFIQAFEDHKNEFADLMPYEARSKSYDMASSSSRIEISATGKWYGNDRIETDLSVGDGRAGMNFAAVRSYPFAGGHSGEGMALCSPDLVHNATVGSYEFWLNARDMPPFSVVPINLPINPLLPLTDLIVRNNIAYISTDSSVASDPDLIVVNIGDRLHPHLLASLNTGPGIAGIALAGNHIFAAALSTQAQLHVIRLDAPDSIYLGKKYKLPLPEVSTSPPFGSSIFYRDKKIYLGTEKWDAQEFSIIDVASPENPSRISGFETDSKVNNIYVHGNLAFIAASNQNQLITLDIKNPETPIQVDAFGPSGWQRQEGKSISVFEDSLVFGRTSGGFNIINDKELFALASSTNQVRFDADIPGGSYGIIQDRNHIFAATKTPDEELSVFDSHSGTSTVYRYSLPVQPQKITCDGNRLFILAKTAPVIYEITFKRP